MASARVPGIEGSRFEEVALVSVGIALATEECAGDDQVGAPATDGDEVVVRKGGVGAPDRLERLRLEGEELLASVKVEWIEEDPTDEVGVALVALGERLGSTEVVQVGDPGVVNGGGHRSGVVIGVLEQPLAKVLRGRVVAKEFLIAPFRGQVREGHRGPRGTGVGGEVARLGEPAETVQGAELPKGSGRRARAAAGESDPEGGAVLEPGERVLREVLGRLRGRPGADEEVVEVGLGGGGVWLVSAAGQKGQRKHDDRGGSAHWHHRALLPLTAE